MSTRFMWTLALGALMASPIALPARAELPCPAPVRGALIDVNQGRFIGHGHVDICPPAPTTMAGRPTAAVTVEIPEVLVRYWRRRFVDPRFEGIAVAAADAELPQSVGVSGPTAAETLREAVRTVIDGAHAIRVTAHPGPEDEAAQARERGRIVAATLVELGQPPDWITVDVGPARGRGEVVVSPARAPNVDVRRASSSPQALFSGSVERAIIRSASGPAGQHTLHRGWLMSLEQGTAALGDFAVVQPGPSAAPVATTVMGTATVGDHTTTLLMADPPADTLAQVQCSSVLTPRQVISVESRRGPLLTARMRFARLVRCDPETAVLVQLLAPGWEVDAGPPAPYAVARYVAAGTTTMTLTVDLGWGAGLGALAQGLTPRTERADAGLRAIVEAADAFAAVAEQTAARATGDGHWRDTLLARRAWLKSPPCTPERETDCQPGGYITRAERTAELAFVEAALNAPPDGTRAKRWRAFQRALAR